MSSTRRVIPLVPVASAPGSSAIEPFVKIQARGISGLYTRWRWAMVWLTQVVFYGLPWLNWHGRQAVLFDVEGRRFYLFDAVLFPQDMIYLAGLLVFCALLLFFATAVAGRVWCGFACPQTVYTELFMWIEQRTEGDRLSRLRLDAAPWGANKLLRRGGKHLGWLLLSLVTGFSLVGWFTPVRSLLQAVPTLAFGPWEAFWILFYGAATYLHAGVLREKVCQHACPYGRFQGSMLDARTLAIGYDVARGEPRGARARGTDARAKGQGDCVDCTLCVQVCPVGIDIRQGLQAACISCGLCIDACDQVMDKLGAPRGLVRFGNTHATASGQIDGWRQTLRRPRVLLYGTALLALSVLMAAGWAQRPELRMNVIRDRSVLAREVEDGAVENVYRLHVMNASLRPRVLRLRAISGDDQAATTLQLMQRGELQVDAAGETTVVVTLRMPAREVAGLAQRTPWPIRFIVEDASGARTTSRAQANSTFLPS